ncbi:MAG: ATP-dependent Clp protease adaptor ClpS [Bacteroidetes bacterium]|nr:MAG: ATP-dependent Clp protease adaptor ClpS [Bacteroidota bacterium]
MIRFDGQTQYEEDVLLEELLTDTRKLVLYNDDVNTFDHVIECLVEICKHEPMQAEQCAMIVHYKGKAIVKEGEEDAIKMMCTALCDEGLSAVIE